MTETNVHSYTHQSRFLGTIATAARQRLGRFEGALNNDVPRAKKVLTYIQNIYETERKARGMGLDAIQVKELHLQEALPVINEMGIWIAKELKNTVPKSQRGKAMDYAANRWDPLTEYLKDRSLKVDNNNIENAIISIALGRKNYLFAGSHEAGQRAAMIYSFFAICKKHEVNPLKWLKYTLENIMSINHKNLKDFHPQNFKNIAL